MGLNELILKEAEVVARVRVCSNHFSPGMRTSVAGSKFKKGAEPDLFNDGVGYKGVNICASISSHVLPENEHNYSLRLPSETHKFICDSPQSHSKSSQTTPDLSSSTPRKRTLRGEVKTIKKGAYV
ncbi:hypothetical protein FQR65_LT16762 [Abscondita terminalis]|nr:hypothetical protein FQR65_LT16762 [Abscondita terminalis]